MTRGGANEHHKQCDSDFESCGASASTRCDGAFEYKAGVKSGGIAYHDVTPTCKTFSNIAITEKNHDFESMGQREQENPHY